MSTSPLNELAPYPRTEAEVTADALVRNLAVWAYANRSRRRAATTAAERDAATAEIVNLYGIVKVLRALQTLAPDAADEVARGVWRDWEDGAAVDEWLSLWLAGYGIEPSAVDDAAKIIVDAEAA
ncbi:hypothetical protein [Spirillospora sp. NBC_01491]|uniref:hypothetical protein n=1 Tax=Spirillospora sp. NBC_01491 TaxID=2976007 RepID=UPI002E374359|nr:hypothetical protein [Spirillospora sp. NBC_01491]